MALIKPNLLLLLNSFKDDNVIKVDKYNLSSPEIKDTSLIDFVFLDQQRYQLSEGDYTLRINITDINKTEVKLIMNKPLQ